MDNFKQTKTYKNLVEAYSGECMARVKYEFYEKKARKDGYEQIANVFKETAHNEKAHAYIWFEKIYGGKLQATDINLKDAASGEHFEWSDMYKSFEKDAREENYVEIADSFAKVAAIEKQHEDRYKKLSENMQKNLVFSKKTEKYWKCLNCGHTHNGIDAESPCPVCSHPVAFFEIECENY